MSPAWPIAVKSVAAGRALHDNRGKHAPDYAEVAQPMATPTEHATPVAAFLARESNSGFGTGFTEHLDDEWTAAKINSTLSAAAGTGTEYTTGDDLLTQAKA